MADKSAGGSGKADKDQAGKDQAGKAESSNPDEVTSKDVSSEASDKSETSDKTVAADTSDKSTDTDTSDPAEPAEDPALAPGTGGGTGLFVRRPILAFVLSALIVGGPPQPPMVLPQAMEQLLRRPDALASAHRAAVAGDEALTFGHIFEALRFDPISPILPREATMDCVIAQGTPREHKVAKGDKVIAAIQSAMSDPRRIPSPGQFLPTRQPYEYLHFGLGLHECFGRHMNRAMFPAICAPLLRRNNLRRADGKAGHLAFEGFFPASLTVLYD